jgi:hypothetical protein
MRYRCVIWGVAVAAAMGVMGSSVHADTLVYDDTTVAGALGYSFSLANTFKVNSGGLFVDKLAAFDSPKANIPADRHITVGLFDDTTNSVAIAAIDFASQTFNGVGGSYYTSIAIAPYALISGHTYSIEAWGFDNSCGTSCTGAFFVPHAFGETAGGITFNSLGGMLTDILATGVGKAATQWNAHTGLFDALGGTGDDSNLRYNTGVGGSDFTGAASLEVIVTPLPAALPLFATGLGAMGLFGWRRKRKAAAIAAI